MNRLLKILTAFVLGISLLTACEDNGWEKGSAKLEKSSSNGRIVTVKGVGYKWED